MAIKHIEKARLAAQKARIAAAHLKSETKKQISTAILSAFALIIALAWIGPITGFVDFLKTKLNVSQGQGVLYLLYSAILVTIVCVIGMVIIARTTRDNPPK